MKKYTYIIIGLIIVVAFVFIINSQSNKNNEIPFASLPNAELYCYLYESPVSNEEGEEIGVDREYIEFALNLEKSEIQGIHNVVPANEPGHYATLVGASDQGYMNTIATVDYQGSTWQEQRIYRFDNERLYVGYQTVEVPRVKNEFGVYMYEDIYEIEFETEIFYLNKISCGSFDTTTILKKDA